MTTKTFNNDPVTADAGRRLFLDGGSIANATRFRDMPSNDADLVAYFDWEVQSLIAYAHSLPTRYLDGSPRVIDCCTATQGLDVCRGVIGEMGDGRRKCIVCGVVQAGGDAAY
jgi:hypothetical protein